MSLGSILLGLRQRFGHGLRVAYWRDLMRPKILATAPIVGTNDLRCEIHVLTSAKDWLDLMWALKSFYCYSARRYALCIHDDGSLTPAIVQTLQQHFPEARIIVRAEADAAVLPQLSQHPRCLEFRRSNHLSPKLFDFVHYLRSPRMLLLDSDVLFFAAPTELLRRIEDPAYQANSVNGDVASAYNVAASVVAERCHFQLVEKFNSGLGLIHQSSIQLAWIEEFLRLPGILSHFWRIEQTLFALCSSRFGVELLPPEYSVHLVSTLPAGPCRHYVGAIRHLLYGEGIKRLVHQGFLQPRS